MSESTTKWTPAQLAAIRHVDGALLVSAAAGSGKTAVLAERCSYLVCDAPEPCDVDELLVLTFTRAAAAEMRERIDGVIRRRAQAADAPPRLARQLRLIDRAQITTLDAFCGQIVRSHFHLVAVDPGFAVLAPEDAILLKHEVIESLVDAEYDGTEKTRFAQLLDGYFGSDDANLQSQILSAHAMLQSVVDPPAWIATALGRLREGGLRDDSPLLREYAAVISRRLKAAIRTLDQVAHRATSFPDVAVYAKHATEIADHLRERLLMAEALRLDTLAAISSAYEVPTAPRIKGDPAGKAELKGAIDDVKKAIKPDGALGSLCRFSSMQLRSDLVNIAPLAEYFFELVRRFGEAYDIAKRNLRSLDFADVETLALKILHAEGFTPSPTALELQTRFRHVLVDEYQDINPLQNAILRLVSRDRGAELSPQTPSNFFTVGDVKQSIYGFRLAEPRQFVERQTSLRDTAQTLGKVIDLQENFRSRAPLLGAVNDVFRLLMTEASADVAYDATQELRALNDYPPIDGEHFVGKPMELHLLPKDPAPAGGHDDADDEGKDRFEREIDLVAKRIRELVSPDVSKRPLVMEKNSSGLQPRPLRYGDIAILLRTRRIKSSQMSEALRGYGIPVHSDDATGFFTATEVQDVLSVLRVLSNGRQDVPLAAVLRSPFSPVSDKEDALAKIRIAYPDEPYHRAVVRYADQQDDALATQLRSLLDTLAGWRRMFQERPVGESLLKLYEHNHFLTFCRALPDGEQRVANLGELLKRGEAFDSFERQGLDRFLAFLDELEVDDQLGKPSVGKEAQDVVQVMTVHKSKGLEFPVIIIPDLGKAFNEQALTDPVLLNRDKGVGMTAVDLTRRVRYPSAASVVVRDHARRQAIAEEIRVLYVALTRAREHLILIGTVKAGTLDAWRDAWATHEGPLPDETIQDAGTALDWLGPIAAITDRKKLGTFAITDHSIDTAETTAQVEEPVKEPEAAQPAPLDTLDDPDAKLAIARITYAYPHQAATLQRATTRVTDVVGEAITHAERTQPGPRVATPLQWPEVYRASDRPKAIDIGTATHRALQYIDFAVAADVAAIDRQLAGLVGRRLMSEMEARLVDKASIAWFASTPLARGFGGPGVRVVREQSLALSMRVLDSDDPKDAALMRGRVDALLIAPEGLTLIDYKTDRVDAADADARAALYGPQMLGYANALEKITRQKVLGACLVFLRARQIIDAR